MRKILAFTLAETLIVMGIIGVVAALTIPNLNQSTGDREKVAKLKKEYAVLEDAFGRAVATYGPISRWFTNLSADDDAGVIAANRMGEFLKISKTCEQGDSGCFGSGVYKAGGGNTSPGFSKSYLLADGAAIGFFILMNDCSLDFSSDDINPALNTCGSIQVDLDGAKGVNEYGNDTFEFLITKSGIYPAGGQNTTDGDSLATTCFSTGFSCAGWVIENENMEYLKANGGKCSNGTELSWATPTCK